MGFEFLKRPNEVENLKKKNIFPLLYEFENRSLEVGDVTVEKA